ncbi:MAG TPA: 3-hydroxyacyl-CoA dehydrogenase NAD-binding domain-containing protein [Methanomassiliicoccales archaeon]|nr:3-hydroxyacyl-CoA dehydrogenase NAD-binding domain-containing protein [Methanomassiliicoccales archaeon]
MGVQICTVLLKAGYDVVLKTRSPERMEGTRESVTNSLLKSMAEDESRKLLKNLRLTVSFQDLADRDISIEAVKEDAKVKTDNLKAVSFILNALVTSRANT